MPALLVCLHNWVFCFPNRARGQQKERKRVMEIGPVSLVVADLERSRRFYEGILGCTVLAHNDSSIVLGGEHPLLLLTERRSVPRRPEHTTGLYHLALLLPGRVDLACALLNLREKRYPLQGCEDHGISEAIYLADPDGNGIELYRDRPRSAWPWHHGRLEATEPSAPLHAENLLAELDGTAYAWRGLPPSTRVGHIHLQVADLAQCRTFYHGILGLEESITGMSGACFFAANGYHHHIACNVWSSRDAPPPRNALGLHFFTVMLPVQRQVVKLASRVSAVGIEVTQYSQSYLLRDPSQNRILLTAESFQYGHEILALASIVDG
jgi:catechol 2,3-dioxygenase